MKEEGGFAGMSDDLRWLERFSVERYRLMERLLSEADYEFLASQKGYEPRIGRDLRRKRRRIMRLYLRRLESDVARVHKAARLKMACASGETQEFWVFLLKQSAWFTARMMWVRAVLSLYAAPDVRPLLDAVDVLVARTRGLVPAGEMA
jgi:hypothetical protein